MRPYNAAFSPGEKPAVAKIIRVLEIGPVTVDYLWSAHNYRLTGTRGGIEVDERLLVEPQSA
jgi:hypothetical protein